MTDYACGHSSDTIIVNDTVLAYVAYLDWKDSFGFDGDKTKCFSCYCKEEQR